MSAREIQALFEIAHEAVRTFERGEPRRFRDTTCLRHTPDTMPAPVFFEPTRPYDVTG